MYNLRRSILIFVALVIFHFVNAQEVKDTTYWKSGGDYNINFTQVSFTNWSAGGQESVSGVTRLKMFSNYKKANVIWDNQIDLAYGLSKIEKLAVQKNEDLIDFQSKIGIKRNDNWFYSGLVAFKTQFSQGYKDADNKEKISNFLAPAYLTVAVGMNYKPNDNFSLNLAPVSGKVTFVTDEDLQGNYGVDVGLNSRSEFGASLNALSKLEIVKNVTLINDLGLFSNYLENPQEVDVDWKLAVNMKINDYLSAQINTHLIYDADIVQEGDTKAKIQFKEMVGVGLNIKF